MESTESSSKKRDDAINRARIALKEMESANMVINFQSVAQYAKVSKSWLYSRADISEEIKGHRNKPKNKTSLIQVVRRPEHHTVIRTPNRNKCSYPTYYYSHYT